MEPIDLLSSVDLFAQLSPSDLAVLAEHAGVYEFAAGGEVFAAGVADRELFVIESGDVRIVKDDPDGREIDIARFVTGESFGEQDFLSDDVRTVRGVAETPSRILIFPARGTLLDSVMMEHPRLFARVLHQFLVIVAGRIRSTNKLVSENSSWVEQLRQQVFGDPLTGLYSKSYLDDEFAGILSRSRSSVGFLMIKPDNFKLINDTWGHDVGDQALRILANRLKRLVRGGDVAVRFRGNEFSVILPDSDRLIALGEAERIRLGLQEADLSPVTGGERVELTFSVGVAVHPEHAGDNVSLAARAHEAVFLARDAGGDRVVCAVSVPENA